MTTPASGRSAPTSERGHANPLASSWWGYDVEDAPELRWPLSLRVYDAMRKQDAQVTSVLRAVTLPVRRTPWRVDPNGARPEVAELLAQDLGLPLVGGSEAPPPLRTRDRFSWPDHLRHALLSTVYGFMPFEQVYRIDEAGRARIRKLAPRMPRTVRAINVARDGGLVSIEQEPDGLRVDPPVIPVDRLVMYVHDREGGDWQGRSLLRPAYKHWLLKDRALRTQAQTLERNGMGVPVYTGADGEDSLDKGLEIAQSYRGGDNSGAALPHGATLELKGVDGDLPDADPVVRYHDEQIARAVLAHFLNLGTQTGSWALGSTFADFFVLSLQALAEQIADTANAHIVEDWVDLNYGPDEPAPRLIFDEIGSKQQATAGAIKALVDAGVLLPDRLLEETVRQSLGLPPKATQAPPTLEETT